MTRDAAWIEAGGSAELLGMYRRLGRVDTVTDGSGGHALVFHGACGQPGLAAVGDLRPGERGGHALLWAAERALRASGTRMAVGPMDGNTFFAYRACVGSDRAEAPFAGEPLGDAEPFRVLGWREEARYRTTRCPNAPQIERGRPLPQGWGVRPIDLGHFDDEIAALHRVTHAAFSDAHRYAPLPLELFRALYAPFRGRVDPRFVLLAHDPSGAVQGYVFAWPERGRFVLKTLAVHPEARGARLATHLMARVHAQAEALGLPYGLHALMWEGSVSRAITAHGGRTVRQYALYRKRFA